jgi:uncharacterized protein YjbJ (UPF0337 family)
MSEDRIEGAARQGLGRAEDAIGGLTGNGRTQANGKIDQAKGKIQDAYGQIKGQAQDALDQAQTRARDALEQAQSKAQDIYGDVEDYIRQNPLAAVGVGVGVGIVLGLLLRGGKKTVYIEK